MRFLRLLMAVSVFLLGAAAWSQTSAAAGSATYDPRLTFAPLTLPDPVNAYRSSNGAPGPAYWQNEADYELHAALDTAAKQLQQRRNHYLHQQQPRHIDQPLDPAGAEHLSQRFARADASTAAAAAQDNP